jgi:hypothetical protein
MTPSRACIDSATSGDQRVPRPTVEFRTQRARPRTNAGTHEDDPANHLIARTTADVHEGLSRAGRQTRPTAPDVWHRIGVRDAFGLP